MAWKYPKFKVFDSDTGKDLPHRIFSIAYLPEWQLQRTKCSFRTHDEVLRSISLLNVYVSLAPDEKELQYRTWRVYNLMNAVPIGQAARSGIEMIPSVAEDLIVPYRNSYIERVARVGRPTEWDWRTTRRSLLKTNKFWLEDHLFDLIKVRANKARLPQQKPELQYYLYLVELALDGEL